MKAPSHYLKQCGLIIKLINRVPWHLSQWIIIRYQSVKWDWDLYVGVISASAMKSFINSEVIKVCLCHSGKLIFIVTIFNPSGLCLLKGNKVPCPCVFCDHTTGGQCSKKNCCMKSQSHERLWPPLLKLKFENDWLPSNYRGSSCKKINSGFQFQFQFQGFQFQFHFQFHQFQFQFQFRNWNWNWAAIPIPELNWPQPWW